MPWQPRARSRAILEAARQQRRSRMPHPHQGPHAAQEQTQGALGQSSVQDPPPMSSVPSVSFGAWAVEAAPQQLQQGAPTSSTGPLVCANIFQLHALAEQMLGRAGRAAASRPAEGQAPVLRQARCLARR